MEPTLFPQKQPTMAAPDPSSGKVNVLASRLAVLEERLANLRKSLRLNEQALLSSEQEARDDLKAMEERLLELAHKVEEVKEKIDAMAAELGSVVKKHEVTVLERYLDLWQPLSFVTRDEAKLLIKDALAARDAQQPAGQPSEQKAKDLKGK